MAYQLELSLKDPPRINVSGMIDAKNDHIRFLSEAVQQFDGTWRCVADVDGLLCWVQVTIKAKGGDDGGRNKYDKEHPRG